MQRVVLIASSPRHLWVLDRQLRDLPGFRITGMLDSRRAISPAVADMRPDLIVVDGPSDVAVVSLVEAAAKAAPEATVVVLTNCEDQAWVAELHSAGAEAIVSRSLPLSTTATLLREIAAGTILRVPRAPAAASPRRMSQLTDREIQILQLAAQGRRNQQIADRLCVTPQTVKFHLTNIYRKLGVTSRTGASAYAYSHGLVPWDPEDEAPRAADADAAVA